MFVRQDIPFAQQLAQSNHATERMARFASYNPQEVSPYIVIIGVPDLRALKRVIAKLQQYEISHQVFDEPDDEIGLSAVATVPLNEAQRQLLNQYRVWRDPDVAPMDELARVLKSNQDLNRRNQALEHALTKETEKRMWYKYYQCVSGLYDEEKQRADGLQKELESRSV